MHDHFQREVGRAVVSYWTDGAAPAHEEPCHPRGCAPEGPPAVRRLPRLGTAAAGAPHLRRSFLAVLHRPRPPGRARPAVCKRKDGKGPVYWGCPEHFMERSVN